MNKIILIGNLVKDPEIRATATSMKVANLSIAINDGKDKQGQDQVQYFNCTAFDKTADLVEKYVKKGHKIMVAGKAKNKSWDKPDGTKGYGFEVVVSELELLTSKADAQNLFTAVPISNTPLPSTKDLQPEIDVAAMNVQMPF